jgi:polyisoprenoid-binding protein YceI
MSEQPLTTWQIDAGHSTLQFNVKHLALANVTGIFTAFNGTVQTRQDDFDGAQIILRIDAHSLSTNNEPRDAHLKSDSFFDAHRFPYLTFNGTLRKLTEEYKLVGALMIRNVSRPIELAVLFTGMGKGRFGDSRAGFELNGQINRHDFGLTWGMMTETGGLVVGDMIKLSLDIELVRQEIKVAATA